MYTTPYQRKSSDNTVIDINSDTQSEITSSYSFGDYAKAGLAIAGALAGVTVLANKTGFSPPSWRGSNASPDNLLDNQRALINPQEGITFADNSFPIHPRHVKRAGFGGEFQINTYTTSIQRDPTAATLSTGDFVVVWQSDGQDGDSYGIYGQRFSSTGIPQGTEFQVNTYITLDQTQPSIAALNSGDFVVVWVSYGQDGDRDGIYGQRFSSTGIPQGAEFQVNTYTVNHQSAPSIAALNAGDFLVVWQSDQDGSGYGIDGQRFSNTGVPQGSEFQINTYTTSTQRYPSAAALTTDDFVVVWESSDQDGDSYGIYGQRFSNTGVSQGSEFQINTYTANYQSDPSIAALNAGDFVVTWTSRGQDGDLDGIYGQHFSNTGVPQGSEFQINTYTANYQNYPSVAGLSTGDFLVVWQSDGQDGSDEGIYGQRFSNTGAPQGSEFQLNNYTIFDQRLSSVAALNSGDFVVLWQSFGQDGDDKGIYGRIFFNNSVPPRVNK